MRWIALIALVLVAGCTEPVPVDPDIEVLEKKIQALGAELAKIETSIANSEADPALKAMLQEDQKLTESRKERLLYELKKKKPFVEAPAGGHGAPPPAHH